jgi:hypothetical protein
MRSTYTVLDLTPDLSIRVFPHIMPHIAELVRNFRDTVARHPRRHRRQATANPSAQPPAASLLNNPMKPAYSTAAPSRPAAD